MKRYWIFAGQHYYPAGGMGDFAKWVDTLEEAKEYLLTTGCHYEWYSVIDTQTVDADGPKEVAYADKGYGLVEWPVWKVVE
jgi:hypothetical protein